MSRRLELIESIRGFAAFYVFIAHLLLERGVEKNSIAGFFFRFGQEAVMLFFIISGFVVYYSTRQHADSRFRIYFVRRLLRIYPIYALALLIAYFSDAIGSIHPPDVSTVQLVGNLFLFEDVSALKPGVWVNPLCGNSPLWSLSYEWWFYMMFFPIYRYVRPDRQLAVAGAISLIGAATYWLMPNQVSLIAMYFILWWSGVELARAYTSGRALTLANQRTMLGWVAVVCICVGLAAVPTAWSGRIFNPGTHPLLELRHFVACLSILTVGLAWSQKRWYGFRYIFGPFAVLSPISYALYVLHYPIAINPVLFDFLPWLPARLIAIAAVCLLLAYLAEGPYQRLVNRVADELRRRWRPPSQSPEAYPVAEHG